MVLAVDFIGGNHKLELLRFCCGSICQIIRNEGTQGTRIHSSGGKRLQAREQVLKKSHNVVTHFCDTGVKHR